MKCKGWWDAQGILYKVMLTTIFQFLFHQQSKEMDMK